MRILVTLGVAGVIAGCGNDSPSAGSGGDGGPGIDGSTVSFVTLGLTPPSETLAAGTTANVKAVVTLSDMTTKDVTTVATWTSSDPSIATASSGNIGGVKAGTAMITVKVGPLSKTLPVTVTAATLVAIGVTPATPTLAKGSSQQLSATGTFSDHTMQDLTAQATWASSAEAIASVTASGGNVLGVTPGAATITATVGGITGNTTVTITDAQLVSIAVTPPSPSVARGVKETFMATGSYTDMTTQDLTAMVAWASSDPTKATVSAAGVATTLGIGTTTISAKLGTISGSATLTITSATLVSIGVTPATPSLAKGLTQQFAAVGTYTDMTTQDLTITATWASDTTATATVSNATGSNGLASTLAVGTAKISATVGSITASTTLTVTAATLVSIGVTPATPSIAKGLTQQFTATGVYTDTTTQDLTPNATWASATPATATISNAAGSNGLASSVAAGTTSISATLGTVTGSTTLTVTAATLVSIGVTPATPSIAKGLTEQFFATGVYTDATTQDLSATATWTSGTAATATISNADGSNGLATAAGVGTSLVSATLGGVTGSTTLTVTAATLVSIGVTPATPSIAKGLTEQFAATGVYTDASTQDLTTTATWASATSATATISNAAGSNGLASAVAVGTSVVSATLGTVVGSTTLTVTPATLVSIGVTPATPTVPKGLSQQFLATGVYTDTTTQDLTNTATWASDTPATATISNAAGSGGLASTVAPGTSSISATLGAVVGSTTLTVTPATLVSIAVTPADPSVAKGVSKQFVATGTYTDASTQDLTTAATWASATPATATISNAVGSNGLASTPGVGTSSISATVDTVVGSTTLTVTAATLVSVAVTPATPSISKGTSMQFVATGTYTDATTQVLTTTATWASATLATATISNAAGSNGLASSVAPGTTSISAAVGTVVGSTTLTVTAATLVSIAVTPANPSIGVSTTKQFVATGTYTDATTQVLTTAVTWGSSTAAAATISNAAGSNGLATATATPGTSTISATLTGVTGSTLLTVYSDPCISLGGTLRNVSANLRICTSKIAWGSWNPAMIPAPWTVCTLAQLMSYATADTTATLGLSNSGNTDWLWANTPSCGPGSHRELAISVFPMNNASCYNGNSCCNSDSSLYHPTICQP